MMPDNSQKELDPDNHEPEDDFAVKVEKWLIEQYGEDNVEGNKYLSDEHIYNIDAESRRYVDFWVNGPMCDFAIEVENDFDAAFNGVGQSVVYAAHTFDDPNVKRVIILPEDHVEQPEATMMREAVILKTL